MSDHFTHDLLRAALGERPFKFLPQTGSTQDIAREWALDDRDPAPPGAVVIAEEQTAGRGRQGRTWLAPPGSSIMLSAVLHPDLPPEHLLRCTMAAGLAVLEAVKPLLGDAVTLKWPNDIVIGRKKLCGVLSEASWIGAELGAVIVGIGLNVRTRFEGTEFPTPATSIDAELGYSVNRYDVLRALLARLDHWAARISDPVLFETWRTNLGTLGKPVTVHSGPPDSPSATFSGIAESVDETGALLVRLESGERQRILAADVSLAES